MTGLSVLGLPTTLVSEEDTTVPAAFEQEVQKFSPSNLITLFELDLTDIGGDYLRFTSSAWSDQAIQWGGNSYAPVPIEAEGFEVSGKGVLPTPTIRVLNTNSLQASTIALDDLLGATFRRIRTFKTFLDDGDTPDPTAHFPIDIFVVDRKVVQNKVYIEWELAASIDQHGSKIPARQVLRNYCTHIYRRWDEDISDFAYDVATCPYVGTSYFGENDGIEGAGADDRCGKRLSSCIARFGENTELPFRGFPGVSRIR